MRGKIRKCNICKESINIYGKNDDFFITPDNKAIHTHCYIEKYTTRKRSKKTLEECKEYVKDCKENYEKIEKKTNAKNELYEYLFEIYDVVFFPKYFYIKMDSIYKGEMRGLSKPVPPEDLLDMWKQKRNYLDKVAEKNRKKGNEILGTDRVNYDLAILLSKYDAYLKWKQEQKNAIAENESQKKRNADFITYNELVKGQKTKRMEEKDIDISSMLDEI